MEGQLETHERRLLHWILNATCSHLEGRRKLCCTTNCQIMPKGGRCETSRQSLANVFFDFGGRKSDVRRGRKFHQKRAKKSRKVKVRSSTGSDRIDLWFIGAASSTTHKSGSCDFSL
ncbi:hypothetical protein AVEN_231357-1 [Araneus ventricosus]|uniref:Uncharacterized protein n=1 Tax=Araneus ventricosus TaxID=182803 RepID=A0A4Y2GUX6_ARAVE|nr:hypothetical protein AVEN_231357-1 [Araneus ventricosus]